VLRGRGPPASGARPVIASTPCAHPERWRRAASALTPRRIKEALSNQKVTPNLVRPLRQPDGGAPCSRGQQKHNGLTPPRVGDEPPECASRNTGLYTGSLRLVPASAYGRARRGALTWPEQSRGAGLGGSVIHLPRICPVVPLVRPRLTTPRISAEWPDQVRGGTEVILDEHTAVPLVGSTCLAGHRPVTNAFSPTE